MTEIITQNILIFWLALGVMCIILEAGVIPGVGFLFVGLSAVSVGGLLSFSLVDPADFLTQILFFFGLTIVWAIALWVPLKNFSLKGEEEAFSNMVGDLAVVQSDELTKDKVGKVKWSGTTMRARLHADDEKDSMAKDDEVYVESVRGNIMTVTSTKIEAPVADSPKEETPVKPDSEGDQ